MTNPGGLPGLSGVAGLGAAAGGAPSGPFGPAAPGTIGGMTGANPGVLEPPDWQFENAKVAAGRNVGLLNADAAWNTGQLQRSSGFDAAGNLITSGADFNPFSQAMLLQDEYKRGQAGTLNSYAAQGQYGSGAYGRAQARNDRQYAQGFDQLKTSAQQGYYDIGRAQLGGYAENSLGVNDADFNALKRRYGG